MRKTRNMCSQTRRQWLNCAAWTTSALCAGVAGFVSPDSSAEDKADNRLERETFDFIERCRLLDGSYAPSPDPSYRGESDTKFSDLAAVTYAAVLAKTV